jgi:hypothetical protein
MHDFTPLPAFIGGAFIGLSASILLLAHGKVAGISGLYAGALRRDKPDRELRLADIGGLDLERAVLRLISPQ